MRRVHSTREQRSIALQRQRSEELDNIRLQRRLTDPEQAEADTLAHRLYMRQWRAQMAEREAGLQAIAR